MHFPRIMETCKNSLNGELMQFVGIFDNRMLFSLDYEGYMFCEPENIEPYQDVVQTIDTRGIPIFPSRRTGEVFNLTNKVNLKIIGIAPMLPPHSTVFEYMVMDDEGNIFTVTEPGYILDKYLA